MRFPEIGDKNLRYFQIKIYGTDGMKKPVKTYKTHLSIEEGHKDLFRTIAETSFGKKYYTGKMDFWYFFTSKGIELLHEYGFISFIAPNNWMTTSGGKNMRAHIANSGKIVRFVTFNNVMSFESASQQTMIFLIQKQEMHEPYKFDYKAVGNRQLNSAELNTYLLSNTIGEHFRTAFNPTDNSDGKTIQFLNDSISGIIDKIRGGEKYICKMMRY